MTASDQNTGRYDRVFIISLAVVALLLRIYRIGHQSLWVDELLTLEVSMPKEGLHIWSYLWYNIHGPLHAFVVYLFQLVNTGDGWLRLPSALAGAGAVVYFYLWTRSWLGRNVARIAAVMLAVHPLHLYYSQELRNYSFLLCFGLMSCYYFERFSLRGRRRDFAGYVVTIVLAALSNFSAAFLFGAHSVIYLMRNGLGRRTLIRWSAVCLTVLILLSPWVYRIYAIIDVSDLITPVRPGQLDETQRLRGETTVTPLALPYAVYTYSVGFSLGPSTRELHGGSTMGYVLRHHTPALAWVALLFGGLFLRGGWRVIRGRAPSKELFLYLLIPVVLTYVLNWQNAKAFNVRYILVGFPAFLCCIAIGCGGLKRGSGGVLAGLVIATLLVATGKYYFDSRYSREDIRGAVRYVEEHLGAGECILAPSVRGIVEHYYDGPEPVYGVFNPPGWPRESVDAQLGELFAWCNSLWFIRARPWVDDADGYVTGQLELHYDKTQITKFEGVELFRLDVKKGEN